MASADAEGLAVLHMMHIFTGKVPTFVDGTWQDSWQRSSRCPFPDPMGAVVYHVGHPNQ